MSSKKIAVLWLCLIMLFSFVVIIVEILQPVLAGTIWVDDDYVVEDPTHKKTIQAGIDAALSGDTVFVYSGFYDEDIIIEKTINLTGENRDTTIINGSSGGGAIWARYADFINVSGFTFQNGGTGISIYYSNYSRIINCKSIFNQYGIIVAYSNGTIIEGNIASNNSNYYGIKLSEANNNTIKNNTCYDNFAAGIKITDKSNNNLITLNNCSYNNYGIYLSLSSNNNIVSNNQVLLNDISAIDSTGIAISSADNNTLMNNTIVQNKYGIAISATSVVNNKVINNTIKDSLEFDVIIGDLGQGVFVNTSFDKDSVYFVQITDENAWLKIKWYLHVNVIDYLGNPVSNANIKIEDNNNGTYNEILSSDGNGQIRWFQVMEYLEQNLNGDNIGEKTHYTPHKIVAWNDTLVGYAQPIMSESKTVTIVLYNGTIMDLEPGWNLVSLPRIQSDTNLPTVLQSIEGQYDAVQWYNVTDSNDPWMHNHISKPSNWNDLNEINHTMGLWVHVTDPGGTTLVVFGDVLTSFQNIALYPGWNLVGYPSTTDKVRISALNNIFFDTEVDAIWTHNATTQTWKEITASDNFEVGRGYWIHSKVTKTWIVPL